MFRFLGTNGTVTEGYLGNRLWYFLFGIAGRGVPYPEGYLEIGFGIFDPGNFFLDSGHIEGSIETGYIMNFLI